MRAHSDSFIVWDTVGNHLQYIFMSAWPNNKVMTAAFTRSYEKTVQFWVGHRTAAVSMKQTSVAAADYPSTLGWTQRSYVDCSWQSWCVGSEDHYEPLIMADVCRPTAGRTSMPGMVVPSGVDIWTRANIVCTRFACQQEVSKVVTQSRRNVVELRLSDNQPCSGVSTDWNGRRCTAVTRWRMLLPHSWK